MSILNHFFDYKPEVLALDEKAMELCQPYFRHMEEIRDFNQLKMLKAFADTQMSSTDMLGTTGYGLWDTGRAKLEQIFAEVMGAEDALVRSQFQSGTHTLAVALFGLLRAGDTLLAATGRPYDTLEGVIGLDGKGKGTGTLMDYGVQYDEGCTCRNSVKRQRRYHHCSNRGDPRNYISCIFSENKTRSCDQSNRK